MAEFEVISQEGTRYVKATLNHESIRAESGALCYMTGDLTLKPRIPSPISVIKSLLSDEAVIRPWYTGTGIVYLESSLGGFHVIDLKGETWILDRGIYWASDESVRLSFHREGMLTSFWAGEGFIDFRTKVSGSGQVVLACSGPVEEITLKGEKLMAEGKYVIARTHGVSYKIRRATSFFRSFFSGEGWVRTYQGTGKVLLSSTPYWRYRIAVEKEA